MSKVSRSRGFFFTKLGSKTLRGVGEAAQGQHLATHTWGPEFESAEPMAKLGAVVVICNPSTPPVRWEKQENL